MTFYQYLMKFSADEDEDIRDLAYELELDRNFPRGSTNHLTIRAYVQHKHGNEKAATFERVWKRFMKATSR